MSTPARPFDRKGLGSIRPGGASRGLAVEIPIRVEIVSSSKSSSAPPSSGHGGHPIPIEILLAALVHDH